MSHHCASVGQTEAQDSGRSGKSKVRPTRGGSGAVGKGQQLKKQRSREASKGWRSQRRLDGSDKEERQEVTVIQEHLAKVRRSG